MLILQDTWLPPPVILCDHVDSIEKVLPEFFQIIRLWKTTRDPSYDDFLHVSVRVSVGSHRRKVKAFRPPTSDKQLVCQMAIQHFI